MTTQKKTIADKKPASRPAQVKKSVKRARRSRGKQLSKKTTSLTAPDMRYQEVVRKRIIIGYAAAAIITILALIFLLPHISKRVVNQGQLIGVNSEVLQYTDTVAAYCEEYGIGEYATLMMAIMQQESSGHGTDIFQCSESPFNTAYSNDPNSITDTDYSIQVGVETFAYCLELANCKGLSDTDALKIAIQEYNYGNNYAEWALANYGGYSEENAFEFSLMKQYELGWSSYGDPEYVQHVLRYIEL